MAKKAGQGYWRACATVAFVDPSGPVNGGSGQGEDADRETAKDKAFADLKQKVVASYGAKFWKKVERDVSVDSWWMEK